MTRHHFFALLFLFLAACTEEEAVSFESTCLCEAPCPPLSLKKADRVEIALAGRQYDFKLTKVSNTMGGPHFWGYNDYEMTFYRYDLTTEDFRDSIVLARNGINALPAVSDFFVISPDSILVHTNHHNRLLLLNSKAEILTSWNIGGPLPEGGPSEDMYYLGAAENLPFHYNPEQQSATFFIFDMSPESSTMGTGSLVRPQFATLDLSDGAFTSIYGAYPELYRNEEYSDYFPLTPFAVADGETWTVFFSSHCVYVFDEDKDKRSYCARSRFLPDELKLLPRGLRPSERDPQLIPRGGYSRIVHDPFRDLFYRIAIHDLPPHISVDRDWELRKKAAWSILFLTPDGDCLGEVLFEGSTYDYERVYATEAGLLVSLENPFHPDNEEEMLSFQLFDLSSLTD